MRTKLRKRALGFSIVEVLVVIAILAVLLGIIIPTVQAVRESAANSQCQNNLHQIGVALIHHHDAYGVLPHNGGWDEKQKINATDGSLFTPSTYDNSLRRTFLWGVGQPGISPAEQTGSWCFPILPFLDQVKIYQSREWTQAVATYICPSRRAAVPYDVVHADPWGTYEGGGWKWGKTDYGANEYLIGKRPKLYRLIQITDGASNTVMVGEKAFNAGAQMPASWYYDEGFFLGGSAGTMRHGLEVLRDPAARYQQNWGSAHVSAANFLFADGSVRNFAFGTPWSVMAPQMAPHDGDILPKGVD